MEAIGERYASVWDAISDTPAEALDRKMRSDLMIALKKIIKAKGWTQAEAAKHLSVPQPRVSATLTVGNDRRRFTSDACGAERRYCPYS